MDCEIIIADQSPETIFIQNDSEILDVAGCEINVVINEILENISVSSTEEPLQIVNSEEVLTVITAPDENLDASVKEETLDFTSDEPILVQKTINNISTDTQVITKPAGENIDGHLIVVVNDQKVYKANNTDIAAAPLILGMTITAAITGTDINIITLGEITEASWSWIPDKPVFLLLNGGMTQTVPTTGFMLQVGFAFSVDTIWVELKMPIILK